MNAPDAKERASYVRLYQVHGLSVTKIAKRFRRENNTVKRVLIEAGITPQPKLPQDYYQEVP